MILASDMGSMRDDEYEMMRGERDRLVALKKKAIIKKHIDMIDEQLTNIRKQIKQAHYEQYHSTNRQ